MSHLICCERVSGGRVFFYPEAVDAFLEGGKDGKGAMSVFLRNNNIVQLKNETPDTLLAKMSEAKGGIHLLVVHTPSPEIMAKMTPVTPAAAETEDAA